MDEDDNDELKSFDGFRAYAKTVAFSVRTNVMYDGTLDDDSPVHGSAVRSPVIDIKILSINNNQNHPSSGEPDSRISNPPLCTSSTFSHCSEPKNVPWSGPVDL